ncbi:MAG: tyrosine-protein kinase family protein [Oscillospiraceae bacterium]|nr:tyrosine-protein kinase family protein [Oscillospiraceae bacterium]
MQKKALIITGHYGSGKTNIAVNLALDYAAAGERVCIIDLDIVNPYFRTADFGELFEEKGIRMIAPQYANTNLDIPSLGFDMAALLREYDRVIIDVGGDDAGAIALGQYATILQNFGYEMLYVVNSFRYLTGTPDEAVELLRDIELVSRLKATGIVNSSNLGAETTAEDVLGSVEYAERAAETAGLPLVFTVAERRLGLTQFRGVEVYVRPFWE